MTRNGIALMRHGSVMADSELVDFLSGPTDSAIKFNGSADLHTPIHPPHDNTSRNPEFNYQNYQRFNLDEIPEPECKAEFRFNKNDIPVLAEVLGLPETLKCSQRTVANKLEGLCMLLRRTAYSDLIPRFGRPVPELSMITNCVVDYLYDNHGYRLTQWNHQIMSPPLLQTYADAVSAQGAPLNNCFGFIDGTVRPICRPVELQEVVYNGHKRVHALKFQSLTVPSGLIANLFGPVGTFFGKETLI